MSVGHSFPWIKLEPLETPSLPRPQGPCRTPADQPG
jgi:hypothetical protein